MKKLADDEQVQIDKLQAQMQFDSALLQAKAAAHKLGLEQGVGIGAGAMILLAENGPTTFSTPANILECAIELRACP